MMQNPQSVRSHQEQLKRVAILIAPTLHLDRQIHVQPIVADGTEQTTGSLNHDDVEIAVAPNRQTIS